MKKLQGFIRNYMLQNTFGVSLRKKYLALYVDMFEWSHNLKRVTDEFLKAVMIPNYTYSPT